MCKQCNTKPVYEFTNKKKLCRTCFMKYFQKKVFYIINKFSMLKKGEKFTIKKSSEFRGAVLQEVLEIYAEKARAQILKKSNKIAVSLTLDNQASETLRILIKGKLDDVKNHQSKTGGMKMPHFVWFLSTARIPRVVIQPPVNRRVEFWSLKKVLPIEKKGNKIIIKPLYLFLDEEVLLYAKLKRLKFRKSKEKKDKFRKFLDEMEKKHPEVKRAVVKSLLDIYGK